MRREGKNLLQSYFKKKADSTPFYYRLNSTWFCSYFLDPNKAQVGALSLSSFGYAQKEETRTIKTFQAGREH